MLRLFRCVAAERTTVAQSTAIALCKYLPSLQKSHKKNEPCTDTRLRAGGSGAPMEAHRSETARLRVAKTPTGGVPVNRSIHTGFG